MYAIIRHYIPQTGAVSKDDVSKLKTRLESGFLPLVQEVPGFHSYYAVNVADNELVTVGVFETADGAAESTRRAAEFVRNDPLRDRLGTPEIMEGEVLAAREAAVGAR